MRASSCVKRCASPDSSLTVKMPPASLSRHDASAGSIATHSSTVFTSRSQPNWRISDAASTPCANSFASV